MEANDGSFQDAAASFSCDTGGVFVSMLWCFISFSLTFQWSPPPGLASVRLLTGTAPALQWLGGLAGGGLFMDTYNRHIRPYINHIFS